MTNQEEVEEDDELFSSEIFINKLGDDEISKITQQYWTEGDREELARAQDFKDMLPVAMRVIKRMSGPIGQVCGPISSGGEGIEINIIRFHQTIHKLQKDGKNIFDQMPFEAAVKRIKAVVCPNGEYPEKLLTEFYLPIFKSGYIKYLYFRPKWHTSRGSLFENRQGTNLSIKRIYLKE